MKYCITNGKLILKDQILESNLYFENEHIVEISNRQPNDEIIIDAKGNYVSPGFIEMHAHGRNGYDVMDATKESIEGICQGMVSTGVTGYLPTTMTMSIKDTAKAIDNIKENIDVESCRILGVHMEGPFFSKDYCGAQPEEYMIAPTIDNFLALTNNHVDIIKKISLAPELEGMDTLIPYLVQHDIIVSLGHTGATYLEAQKGIDLGATSTTHTYNAMSPLKHRDPGVVGASMYNHDVYAELIMDGLHVNYVAAKILIQAKGGDHITIITDSLCPAGLPEGIYSLANQPIEVRKGACYLKDTTTLAGSITSMNQEVYNLIHYCKIPLVEAIKMASTNQSKSLGIHDLGEIQVGYLADLIIFNEDIDIQTAIVNGKIQFSK